MAPELDQLQEGCIEGAITTQARRREGERGSGGWEKSLRYKGENLKIVSSTIRQRYGSSSAAMVLLYVTRLLADWSPSLTLQRGLRL